MTPACGFITLFRYVAVSLFVIDVSSSFSQGGPPLVTDDPGTPGNGNWEINAAVQTSPTVSGVASQIPVFDINYGYGDHIQLNLVVAWVDSVSYGESQASGLSNVSSAVKWRLIDEDKAGAAVSIYPRIDSRWPFSSRSSAVNPAGARYFLPVEVSKTVGRFGFNPEIGYARETQAPCEWAYGVAFSFELEKERELLFELHGRSEVGESGVEWLYDFGTRYAVAESASVIGAIGHTFSVIRDELPFWNVYLGAQLRL